ncbi:hypothetical protein [Pseudomonas frederiksbergensis]|uniref:hypothetical protein n=1 Tax=Pseudomonas frederiksbergensis TaxID=104087 RepID=UPI0021825AA1|nr:hypothetical protein [Pseudomonas frederiksbergensis]
MLGFTKLASETESPPSHLTLSCFTTEGVLDPDFAVKGHLILRNLPIEELEDDSTELAIQPDGKIVISATYYAPGNQSRVSGVLYRVTPKGELDRSFNTTGRVNVFLNDGADPTWVNALQLMGDKILIAGDVTHAGATKAYFARYNQDGTLDRTFGEPANPGVYVLDIADTTLHALVKTADDGFVAIGKSGIDRGEDGHQLPVKGLLVGRHADGQPNLHFNRGEPVLTQLDQHLGDNWHAGFIDADRRITVVSTHSSVHFGRFLDNGLVDTSFGNNGYVGEDTLTVAKPAFMQRRLGNRFVFGGNPLGLGGALGVLWAYWS